MLLIQFQTSEGRTRVGLLDARTGLAHPVAGVDSTRQLAQTAIARRLPLEQLLAGAALDDPLDYAELADNGRLLPPLTHPDDAHSHVTGTGLTHLGSAESRNAMHKKLAEAQTLTDSMKMFQMGLEGGRPAPGQVGVAPEWFYKGDGSIVRASGQDIEMPDFALDGGEETEIVGLYLIGPDGRPWRVGFALGNEFSDHVTEQQNYLYLAHSKLRACSVGPALRVGPLPFNVSGHTRLRDAAGHVRWEKPFLSGEANMSHTYANLEHHHFKYGIFCQPGDLHVHMFGTATLSVADGIKTEAGDVFEIDAPPFGLPLKNPLAFAPKETGPAQVKAL
jgi:hypothetical protein